MSTANVIQIGSEGERAFERVRPLLDALRGNIKEVADRVSKEYDKLPKLEKAVFAERVKEEYGWSRDRLSTFARIGREFPEKKKIISSSNSTAKIDETSTIVMEEIVRTSDKDLRIAVNAGLFENKITGEDIRRFRRTGQLPQSNQPKKPKTDLQKIKSLMVDVEHHMKKASLGISSITAIMYDAEITNAKGREATALIQTFEKLCTNMATANPQTSKRAFAILRGEA